MTDKERKEQVAQMSKTIFSYCLSRTNSYTEAEDLSQEILLECCRCIVNLKDEKAFYSFVWRTADNILKKYYSRKKRFQECELDENISDNPYNEIEERAENDIQLKLISRELAFLRSSYRNTMIEYYVNERSVKEIAEYIQNYVDNVTEKVREIGFYGSEMPTNSIRWLVISKLLKTAYVNIIHNKHKLDFPIDKFGNNGFRWLVEESPNDELYSLGMAYRETPAGDIEFWDVAGINGERMHTKVNNASTNILVSLAVNQPESENEKLICSELINSGLAVNTDKVVKPNCPYFNEKQFAKFMDIVIPASEEICQRAEKNLEVIRNKVVENAPDRLQDYASKMAQLVQFEEVEDIICILCESGWLLPYKSGMHPTTVIYLK